VWANQPLTIARISYPGMHVGVETVRTRRHHHNMILVQAYLCITPRALSDSNIDQERIPVLFQRLRRQLKLMDGYCRSLAAGRSRGEELVRGRSGGKSVLSVHVTARTVATVTWARHNESSPAGRSRNCRPGLLVGALDDPCRRAIQLRPQWRSVLIGRPSRHPHLSESSCSESATEGSEIRMSLRREAAR